MQTFSVEKYRVCNTNHRWSWETCKPDQNTRSHTCVHASRLERVCVCIEFIGLCSALVGHQQRGATRQKEIKDKYGNYVTACLKSKPRSATAQKKTTLFIKLTPTCTLDMAVILKHLYDRPGASPGFKTDALL